MAAPPLSKETRLVLQDPVENNTHLWISWRGVRTSSSDQIALAALAGVLTTGPTSRLQRALIDGRRLAVAVPPGDNGHFDLENGGVFQIAVQSRPGAALTDIETTVDSVLADVRSNGIQTRELERWVRSFAVTSIIQMQPLARRAADLAEGEVYHHNPSALFDDVGAARRLTPADLQRVARKYLGPGRLVLSIVPLGKLDLISKANEPYTDVTPKKP